MADSFVQVDPDGAGKEVDTELIGTRHRQRTQIGGATLGAIAVVTDAAPAAGDFGLVTRIVGTVPVSIAGTIAVSAASLPLPTGASTEATLESLRTTTVSIEGNISDIHVDSERTADAVESIVAQLPVALAAGGGLKIEGVAGGVAVPVSAASLPLPAGAATQATLASILTALGATLDVDATGSTVAISGTVPVSAASLPLPTGASTEATLAAMSAKLPAALSSGRLDVVVGAALPAGTNNIGDVDVASIAAGDNNIGNVDVLTQPARTRTADAISVAQQTGVLMQGLTERTPVFQIVNLTASGDLVTAQGASNKIRVLALFFVCNLDGTVAFRSGGSTALTGTMTLRQGGGLVLPFNPLGWFETAANEKLDVVLATITQLSGRLVYAVVT